MIHINLSKDQWSIVVPEKSPEFIKQFKEHYINYRVAEAASAYSMFYLLNQYAVIAMNSTSNSLAQGIVKQIVAQVEGASGRARVG